MVAIDPNEEYNACCRATRYDAMEYCETLVFPARAKKQKEQAEIWRAKVEKLKDQELQEARKKAGILWK